MKRLITLLLLALSFLAAPAFAADAAGDFPAAKVLFDTGRADVGPEGQAAVRAVADYLKAHAGAKVQLSGFTDTTGDAAANAVLAKQRAEAVQAVLKAAGQDPQEYTGFYVNIGLDRLVMMRYGVDDVRLFHSADLRFLEQFR